MTHRAVVTYADGKTSCKFTLSLWAWVDDAVYSLRRAHPSAIKLDVFTDSQTEPLLTLYAKDFV